MTQSQEAVYESGLQDTWDYTPGADVSAGQVIGLGVGTGRVCAVALAAITSGTLDAVAVKGRFKLKKTADGYAFNQGDKVGWDNTNNVAVPGGYAAEDWGAGRCAKDAAAADDYVVVELNMATGYEAAGSGSA